MDHLQTEARNPASADLDALTALQFVRLMNAEDANVIPAVATQAEAIARAIEVIAERFRAGGRLVYVGAGTSGRLGVLDATECPPTFNAPPGLVVGLIAGGYAALTQAVEGAEDHPEYAPKDLADISLSASDVLVGIATSGRTPYVLGAVDYGRTLGTYTIGLSCNSDADIIPRVDLAITPVVGPEVLSGSTRLKAGTATKLVLNMLTTGAMVRLGKTFGNLMVDLRATNEKLRVRTNRIVREATGLDRPAADALLDRCDRELKTALVAQLAGVPADAARKRLQDASGVVRVAVGANGATEAIDEPTELVLGVDGGGTRTVALLATPVEKGRWRVLGRGEAGPSNQRAVGAVAAQAALEAATKNAFATAGLAHCTVRAACLGLAGAGRPDDRRVIHNWAARVKLATVVDVVADAELLLAAGTPDGRGVAIVAGTGSMVFARGIDGRSARAGGWGALMGDEGSGYAIATAGLKAVARAADGRGPATILTERLLATLGIHRPEELIAALAFGKDRATIAALAPVVLEVAEAGDTVADEIARTAATELAIAVGATARQLAFGSAFPLALAGGLLRESHDYRRRVLAAVADSGLTADPVAIVAEPAEGAVRLALQIVSRSPSARS